MKTYRKFLLLVVFAGIVLSTTSCVVLLDRRSVDHRHGEKRGWFKNTNNPHNPNTTNPGHVNGHRQKKGKK